MQTNLQTGFKWLAVTLLWAGISGCRHSITYVELQALRVRRGLGRWPPSRSIGRPGA